MEPDRTLGHNRTHCFGLQACLLKILDSNTSIAGFLRHPSEKISSPRKTCAWDLCQNLRRILQSPGATAPFQGPHGHKHTLGPMLRKVHFNSATLVAPNSHPISTVLLLGDNWNARRASLASILDWCSGVIPYGMCWSCPTGLNSPAEGILEGGIPQLPSWENLHGLEIPLRS